MIATTIELRITGIGDTKERAISEIFRQVAGKVQSEVDGTCVRIEPVDVVITAAVHRTKTERFLGFLFTRERHTYEVTARIQVEVKAIDIEAVAFTEIEERLTVAQHLLQMR